MDKATQGGLEEEVQAPSLARLKKVKKALQNTRIGGFDLGDCEKFCEIIDPEIMPGKGKSRAQSKGPKGAPIYPTSPLPEETRPTREVENKLSSNLLGLVKEQGEVVRSIERGNPDKFESAFDKLVMSSELTTGAKQPNIVLPSPKAISGGNKVALPEDAFYSLARASEIVVRTIEDRESVAAYLRSCNSNAKVTVDVEDSRARRHPDDEELKRCINRSIRFVTLSQHFTRIERNIREGEEEEARMSDPTATLTGRVRCVEEHGKRMEMIKYDVNAVLSKFPYFRTFVINSVHGSQVGVMRTVVTNISDKLFKITKDVSEVETRVASSSQTVINNCGKTETAALSALSSVKKFIDFVIDGLRKISEVAKSVLSLSGSTSNGAQKVQNEAELLKGSPYIAGMLGNREFMKRKEVMLIMSTLVLLSGQNGEESSVCMKEMSDAAKDGASKMIDKEKHVREIFNKIATAHNSAYGDKVFQITRP